MSPRLQRSLRLASPIHPAHQPVHVGSQRPASPFRTIHRGVATHTREGRLSTLLKDFSEKSLVTLERRVADAVAAFQRTAYLTVDDRTMLEAALERNRGFMANVEAILNEAVLDGAPMEQCVVRAAYEQWSRVNFINISAMKMLGADRPPSSAEAAARRHRSPQRRFAALEEVPFHRLVSPLRGVSRGSAAEGAALTVGEGSQTRLSALMRNASPTYDEAKEVQELLAEELGAAEGRTRFLSWLADLPLPSLRAIQSQLPQ